MQQIYRRTLMPKCDFSKVAKQLNLMHIVRTHFHKNTSAGLLLEICCYCVELVTCLKTYFIEPLITEKDKILFLSKVSYIRATEALAKILVLSGKSRFLQPILLSSFLIRVTCWQSLLCKNFTIFLPLFFNQWHTSKLSGSTLTLISPNI